MGWSGTTAATPAPWVEPALASGHSRAEGGLGLGLRCAGRPRLAGARLPVDILPPPMAGSALSELLPVPLLPLLPLLLRAPTLEVAAPPGEAAARTEALAAAALSCRRGTRQG